MSLATPQGVVSQEGAGTGSLLRVPSVLFAQTFDQLRLCGQGRAECQILWIGPWSDPAAVTEVVHPVHRAWRGGFVLDDAWINAFWYRLAERNEGIRAQVHTHPGRAFHSDTDDAWPILHLEGFLSLVIPNFAQGPVTLERTYMAEMTRDGTFAPISPMDRIAIL